VSAGLPASSVASFLTSYVAGTISSDTVPGLNPSILAAGTAAYKQASADAYRTVFLATIAFSGIGIVCAFFTANGQSRMTEDVAATLHQRTSKKVVGEKV
jgi:hypothetical protein